MARIGIGINENVVISSVGFNDKKWLYIELKSAEPGKEEPSVFDRLLLAGGTQEDTASTLQLNFMSFLLPDKADMTREKKIEQIIRDQVSMHSKLGQILEQFMVTDAIDIGTYEVKFADTGIEKDGSNTLERILDQDVLNKMYRNMATRFIELVTPFLNNPEYAVRVKLLRQSKDKHFATIPGNFLKERPFIELMTVPKEHSRVKLDPYEIKQGLTNAEPLEASTAERKEPELETNPFAPAQ